MPFPDPGAPTSTIRTGCRRVVTARTLGFPCAAVPGRPVPVPWGDPLGGRLAHSELRRRSSSTPLRQPPTLPVRLGVSQPYLFQVIQEVSRVFVHTKRARSLEFFAPVPGEFPAREGRCSPRRARHAKRARAGTRCRSEFRRDRRERRRATPRRRDHGTSGTRTSRRFLAMAAACVPAVRATPRVRVVSILIRSSEQPQW